MTTDGHRFPSLRRTPSALSSGRGAGARYTHQFQLGLLELECVRRFHERAVALQRIQRVDARLGEIAELMKLHQEALARSGEASEAQANDAPRH